jgi:riboflavin kinase/FMN adenylyltransferase
MLLLTDINDIPPIARPCGLTIGSFDGIHLGHQVLLTHLRSKLPPNGLLAVLTFSNHPSHYFTPHAPAPLICPPLQKAKLLNHYGADIVVLTAFTERFSATPFDQLLRLLKQKLSFSYLTLGTGAVFGKGREGDEAHVRTLSMQLDFEVDYLPKFTLHGTPVSSGRIRALIRQGDFPKVETYLGRPYSLLCHLKVVNGRSTFSAKGLCLPPEGIYPVCVKMRSEEYLANARIFLKEDKIDLEFFKEETFTSEVEVIFI